MFEEMKRVIEGYPLAEELRAALLDRAYELHMTAGDQSCGTAGRHPHGRGRHAVVGHMEQLIDNHEIQAQT